MLVPTRRLQILKSSVEVLQLQVNMLGGVFSGPLIFSVALGGLVVSVLATGPKVRGFDPDRCRIFKGDKNPEHTVVDLRHVKELNRIELVMLVS
jgi:hypothetical protein